MNISAVLLAAGLSRRYGSNKLLVEVQGVPLYVHTLTVVPSELFFQAAVVSCYAEILSTAERMGFLPVYHPHPEEGQAASVRLGLSAVRSHADAVLFSVCDQPRLTRSSVERLISAARSRPESICALAAGGERGNPVVFPRKYYSELLRLTGDTGGGTVIRAHPGVVCLVEVPQEELEDLDIPQQ